MAGFDETRRVRLTCATLCALWGLFVTTGCSDGTGPAGPGGSAGSSGGNLLPNDGGDPEGSSTTGGAQDASTGGSCETCGGSVCVDLQSDPLNCGTCGTPCGEGASCMAGACTCPDGLEACDESCVDTQSNGAHCGSCGNDCGSQFCRNGTCQNGCGALTACGNSCVDTQSDPAHCGGCDAACGPGQACQGGSCQCAGETVSFSGDIQPVLTNSCAFTGCHASGGSTPGGGPPGGGGGGKISSLDLSAGNAYGSLLSGDTNCGDLVVPGDPGASVLMGKMTGDNLCGGTLMPKGGDPLAEATLADFAAWICQGALDN